MKTNNSSDLVVVTGAGGFIGGALVSKLINDGRRVRAVDKKPLHKWYQRSSDAENLCLDVSTSGTAVTACRGAAHVFQLAADMGGMGFIENFRIECMRSVLINVHMLEAACAAGVSNYFFSSSACAYNTSLQQSLEVRPLRESDAYPAMAERGYGWEKLYSEMLTQEYAVERGMNVRIARFHNCYGPFGTWRGGREKVPAAICRKVIEAVQSNCDSIEIWGDGTPLRSFMYIDDCIDGIMRIMACDELAATPINLGSSELISVNDLVTMVERIAGVQLRRIYVPGPRGVVGRNSDNTFIKQVLDWEPTYPFERGLFNTYHWIKSVFNKSGYAD